MRKLVIADPKKCVGCGICELMCPVSRDKVLNPKLSRIRVVRIRPTTDTAVACRLCETPRCVDSCPRDALHANEIGVILLDESKCHGCGWCIEACNFGAIVAHPDKKITICDLCEGKPSCVRYCPTKALEFATLDRVSAKSRILAVQRREKSDMP